MYCTVTNFLSGILLLIGLAVGFGSLLTMVKGDYARAAIILLVALALPNFFDLMAIVLHDFTGFEVPVCEGEKWTGKVLQEKTASPSTEGTTK